ncbi:urease accessory protein UreE [Thermoleptolyngbya sp. C42_A2020_037]|uniref:urease accessory protein UreE n=1 Tax=Thermoleptolyngbya sp. C42_A2020_037 TaxID=2747799 RepID=UPI001A072BD8|nr:urease accessory protein UreE [Thermoleptolyngbya sp. C42_A2020_037]MBF2085783.1 urease accessory protein UreE [Thermoleptolyngbya sp. C42_A2020_037]
MLVLTQRLSAPGDRPEVCPEPAELTLLLTAEERVRSRHYFESVEGIPCSLQLPRGTVLRDGDVLLAASGERVRVVARPEPVVTVTAHTPLALLRAAYHLGNRHVPLEVTETYLRFSPDSVLQDMVEKMGLHVQLEEQPFQPETGAYEGLGFGGQELGHLHHDSQHDSNQDSCHHSHRHSHRHSHDHDHEHDPGRDHSDEDIHHPEPLRQHSETSSQVGSLQHSHKSTSEDSQESSHDV